MQPCDNALLNLSDATSETTMGAWHREAGTSHVQETEDKKGPAEGCRKETATSPCTHPSVHLFILTLSLRSLLSEETQDSPEPGSGIPGQGTASITCPRPGWPSCLRYYSCRKGVEA